MLSNKPLDWDGKTILSAVHLRAVNYVKFLQTSSIKRQMELLLKAKEDYFILLGVKCFQYGAQSCTISFKQHLNVKNECFSGNGR